MHGLMAHKPYKGYTRLAHYPIPAILPYIGLQTHVFETGEGPVRVKMRGQRMLLLGRTQECACCRLQGSHFWLEYSGYYSPHFNLYGINDNGHEVMMTLDHILPRSKGGTLATENCQLLCSRCNRVKKNDNLTLEELWKRVFCATKLVCEPTRVGEWVRQGKEVGQISSCHSKYARVRLWCACMTETGRSRESMRQWRYGSFETLGADEADAVRGLHDDCPIQHNYGKHVASHKRLIGHLLRPQCCLPLPKVALATKEC